MSDDAGDVMKVLRKTKCGNPHGFVTGNAAEMPNHVALVDIAIDEVAAAVDRVRSHIQPQDAAAQLGGKNGSVESVFVAPNVEAKLPRRKAHAIRPDLLSPGIFEGRVDLDSDPDRAAHARS
jgi:hypothetical protein